MSKVSGADLGTTNAGVFETDDMAFLTALLGYVKGITFIQYIWGLLTSFWKWPTFLWSARRGVTELSKQNEEFQQENHMLREENIALQEQLRIRGEFTEREGALWKEGENDPYCLGCWQEDNKNHFQMMKYGHEGEYYCLQCPRPWQTEVFKRRQVKQVRMIIE